MSAALTPDSRLEGVTLKSLYANPGALTLSYEFVADHGAWLSPCDPLSGPDGWVRGLDSIEGCGALTAASPAEYERARSLMTEWLQSGTQLRLGAEPGTPAEVLTEPGTAPRRAVWCTRVHHTNHFALQAA